MAGRESRGGGEPPPRTGLEGSAFDQADVTGAGSFGRVLDLELHPLPFTQEFEHGAAHRASVEEVLNARFVADEPEPFVDEKAAIVPVGIPVSSEEPPQVDPRGLQARECRRTWPAARQGADLPMTATPAGAGAASPR